MSIWKATCFGCILAATLLCASCEYRPNPQHSDQLESFPEPDQTSSGNVPEDVSILEEQVELDFDTTEDVFQFIDWIDWDDGEEELEEEAPDMDIDLSVSQSFRITRPSEDELSTAFSSYFITGTSDPDLPVYFEEEEIERLGTLGIFGVYVELEEGENTFTFSQGEEESTVTIVRELPSEEIQLTTEITQSSMFPPVRGGVKVGQEMPVSCIAPAGATVLATFGTETITLEQVVPGASEGVPAVFRGSIPIRGDYEAEITQNAGPVSYTLQYQERTTEYTSSGDVYVAGENSNIVLSVSTYIGFVYPNTSNLSIFQEKLKMGAIDYLKAQNNKYFELASGGYIPVEMAEIVEGNITVEHTLSRVTCEMENKYENYRFHGVGSPAYLSEMLQLFDEAEETEDRLPESAGTLEGEVSKAFSFTLYNTYQAPSIPFEGSKLFEEIIGEELDTSAVYTFQLKENARLWGYNVVYEDGDLILQFRYKPYLSKDEDQPLKGIRILLDPGHGGYDRGANGLPADTGPAESIINLAHAYAIRDQLRELGARVTLTRSGDDYYSLDDRLVDIEATNADIFLSIHHNSIAEKADANNIHGMEIYYHDDLSRPLAEAMMVGLEQGLDRKNRFVSQSYYRVTLLPFAPSILLELRFMSSPVEYEKLINTAEIDQVAAAVADGLILALQDAEQ